MKSSHNLQRSNRRLLLAMMVFAIALCALCLVWMYSRMKRAENGVLSGQHEPARVTSLFVAAHLPAERFYLLSV